MSGHAKKSEFSGKMCMQVLGRRFFLPAPLVSFLAWSAVKLIFAHIL